MLRIVVVLFGSACVGGVCFDVAGDWVRSECRPISALEGQETVSGGLISFLRFACQFWTALETLDGAPLPPVELLSAAVFDPCRSHTQRSKKAATYLFRKVAFPADLLWMMMSDSGGPGLLHH